MKKIRNFIFASLIIVFTLTFLLVPIKDQLLLIPILFRISTVLFAILGAWIEVLDPTTFLSNLPTKDLSPRNQLALKLIPLLITTTVVFVLTIIMKFLTPIFTILLIPYQEYSTYFRGAFGFIITILFFTQIWVIVGTLLPVVQVLVKRKDDLHSSDYRGN